MSVALSLLSLIAKQTGDEVDMVDALFSHLTKLNPKLIVPETFRRLCKIVDYGTNSLLFSNSTVNYREFDNALLLSLSGDNDEFHECISCKVVNDRVVIQIRSEELSYIGVESNRLDSLISLLVCDEKLISLGLALIKSLNLYDKNNHIKFNPFRAAIPTLSPATGDKSDEHRVRAEELLSEIMDGEDEVQAKQQEKVKRSFAQETTYKKTHSTIRYVTPEVKEQIAENNTSSPTPQTTQHVETDESEKITDHEDTNQQVDVSKIDKQANESAIAIANIVGDVMEKDPVVRLCHDVGYARLARRDDDLFSDWSPNADYTPRSFQEFIADSFINYVGGISNVPDVSTAEGQITEFTNDLIKKLTAIHWSEEVMRREKPIELLLNSPDWGSSDMTVSLALDAFGFNLTEASDIPDQLADEIEAVLDKGESNLRESIDALNIPSLVSVGLSTRLDADKALILFRHPISAEDNTSAVIVLYFQPRAISYLPMRFMTDGLLDRYSTVKFTNNSTIYGLYNAGILSRQPVASIE